MSISKFTRQLFIAVFALLIGTGIAFSITPVTNPIDMARYGMIWTQVPEEIGAPQSIPLATEDFVSIDNVFLNGGFDANNHPLAPGYYFVTITTDLAGFHKIATTYPAKPVFVNSNGVFQQLYKLLGTGGLFPLLSITPDTYYYVWIGKNPFTYPPCYPELDRCRFRIIQRETESSLLAFKFWDLNGNGRWDSDAPDNEPPIQNWQIQVFDVAGKLIDTQYTDVNGQASFILDPGTYIVKEVMQSGWAPTTATEFQVDVPEDGVGGPVYFGNIQYGHSSCVYAAPVYYWYSDKGKDKFLADEQGNLDALVALNLVDAAGTPFDPVDYPSVAKWMANVYYTNDAYALSVQLAAMVLNKRAGFVSGSAVVYNSSLGFINIDSLVATADALLALDGYTPVGDPNRAAQDVLRKTLTAANNNLNFVTTP